MTSNRSGYPHVSVGHCRDCEKVSFCSRKTARRVLREMRDHQGMREYRCPVDESVWHVGHLPQSVLQGRVSANEVFGYRRVRLD